MKQSQISLIVIGFILVALMATNPSFEEHKEAIKKEIFKAIESDNNFCRFCFSLGTFNIPFSNMICPKVACPFCCETNGEF